MQGAIIDDEGLTLFNQHKDCLNSAEFFMLELEAAEVVPYADLGILVPFSGILNLPMQRSHHPVFPQLTL